MRVTGGNGVEVGDAMEMSGSGAGRAEGGDAKSLPGGMQKSLPEMAGFFVYVGRGGISLRGCRSKRGSSRFR